MVNRFILIGLIVFVLFTVSRAQQADQSSKNIFPFYHSSNLFELKINLHNIENTRQEDNQGYVKAKPTKKKHGDEFLKSVVIPGWGQLSKDRKGAAQAFFITEVLLIGGYISSKVIGSWFKEDYTTFAKQHAGVKGDQEHQFYVDIGNWPDQKSYNEQRLRDRYYDAVYSDSNQDWVWDSDKNRREFKDLRIKSDQAYQTSALFIGGFVINHLFSAIDASRTPKKENKVSLLSGKDKLVEIKFNW